jgi:hypothetical protein
MNELLNFKEKATSLTNLEPDWNSIMQICDTIRQNDVQLVFNYLNIN